MTDVSKLLIMAFLISGVILGFSSFMVGWSSQYNKDVDSLESTAVISRTFNQTDDLKKQVESSSVSASDPVNGFLVFTNFAIQGVTLITNIPAIFISLIADSTARIVVLPSWISDVAIGIVFVIVTMSIFALILKVKP